MVQAIEEQNNGTAVTMSSTTAYGDAATNYLDSTVTLVSIELID